MAGDEAKRIKAILAQARKSPINFAACLTRDSAVLEGDLRKTPAQLQKIARKAAGTSKGAAGLMQVNGTTMTLTCEASPPSTLGKSLQSMLAQHGQAMSVRFGDLEPSPDPAPQQDGAEPVSDPDAADEDALEEAAHPDDDEDDIAAAAGDLAALLKAVRRKTYQFAFLFGEPSVLKGHRRDPATKLVREAKAEGAGPQGAWGQLSREGRMLIMTVENKPPPATAKRARVHLHNAGHALQVTVRSLDGETLEEDVADETQDTVAGGETDEIDARFAFQKQRFEAALAELSDKEAKRAQSIASLIAAKLGSGDTAKVMQLLGMLDDILGPTGQSTQDTAPSGAAPDTGDPPGTPSAPLEGGAPENPESDVGALPEELDAEILEAFANDETHAIATFLEEEGYAYTVRKRGSFFVDGITRDMSNDALTDHAYEQFLRRKHGDEYYHGILEKFRQEAGPLLDLTTLDLLVIDDPYWAQIKAAGGAWLQIVPLDIPVRDDESAAFIDGYIDDLDAESLNALNQVTDDAFFASMARKPGYKIPSSQHLEADAWLALRREHMAKIVRLSNLPESVSTLFQQLIPGMPLALPAPGQEVYLLENADLLIGMAKDLLTLTASERAGFAAFAGPNGTADDLRRKLDAYLANVADREEASEDRYAKGEKIAGMTKEYEMLKVYLAGDHVARPILAEHLGPRLQAWGYSGSVDEMAAAFKADIEAYKTAFKKEAEQVALRGMAQFETELGEVSHAISDDAAFAETYEECRKTCVAFLEKHNNMGDNDYLFLELQAKARGNPLLMQILDGLGGNEPFGGNRSDVMGMFYKFFSMFDLDDPDAARKFKTEIQKLISKRKQGIKDSRGFIEDEDPEDFIWRTGAVQQTLSETGAAPGSIHASIVGDTLSEFANQEIADAIKLGTAAVAAGLLTMGTGTVAVIGATASFALSSYDAWETYNRYLEDEAGSNAGLIRAEPNFAWAVIAMVSIAPDAFDVIGVASKVAKARRMKAIAELLDGGAGDAVRAFNNADPEDLLEQI
ncbi:MAG: hypothetical protein AB8B60_07045 [Sulfitobacter sp.]